MYERDGEYSFFVTNGGGVKVYIDDKIVLDKWLLDEGGTSNFSCGLEKGVHSLKIELFQKSGNPIIKFFYSRFDSKKNIPKTDWKLVKADSEETLAEDGKAQNAFDGNTATYWITEWKNKSPAHPHEIVIDLGAVYNVSGFSYIPRQTDAYWCNSDIKDYELYLSEDLSNFSKSVAKGVFGKNKFPKEALFKTVKARYVKLVAFSDFGKWPWTNAAEIEVYKE